ncbi:MAG: phytanoyl-CoA dioxygenase family protein [Alphaproteobacteria bacterium]|nr:phytanoyl-CoA dioxygenase family protein [Alphaproteobacteria bacterium]
MNQEQKYLFDTHGYLVLRGVLDATRLSNLNQQMDRLEALAEDQYPEGVVLGKPRTDNTLFISNIVEADPAFFQLIDLPPVIDIISETTSGLFRLNHTNAISHGRGAYTYVHMGGAPLHPKATYGVVNGKIFSSLTKAVFPLTNQKIEDGCFAVIPGSHKSNFERPSDDHPDANPYLVPLDAEPGDCIVFTEALAHGSLVNQSGHLRRTLYFCYSVGYMPDWGNLGLSFSDGFIDKLSPAQAEIVRLKAN